MTYRPVLETLRPPARRRHRGGRFSFQLGQPSFAQGDHVFDSFGVALVALTKPEPKTKPGEAAGRAYRSTDRKKLRRTPLTRRSWHRPTADDPYGNYSERGHGNEECAHKDIKCKDGHDRQNRNQRKERNRNKDFRRTNPPARHESLARSQNLKLTLDLSYFIRYFLVSHHFSQSVASRPLISPVT